MVPTSGMMVLSLSIVVFAGCGPAIDASADASTGSPSASADTGSSTPSTSVTTAGPSSTTTSPPSTTGGPTSVTDGGSTGPSDDTGVVSWTTSGFDPDGGGVTVECSLWEQDCGPGRKCVPWANDGGDTWNAARCVDLDDALVAEGEPCVAQDSPASGFDDCGVGQLCWDVDPDTNVGRCTALCTGSPELPVCEDPSASCLMGNDGIVNVCTVDCEPLLQDCPVGTACYGFADVRVFACPRPGTPVHTSDGLTPAACPPFGNAVDPSAIAECGDDEPCCALWCDLEEPAPQCSDGRECQPFLPKDGSFFTPPGVCVDPD